MTNRTAGAIVLLDLILSDLQYAIKYLTPDNIAALIGQHRLSDGRADLIKAEAAHLLLKFCEELSARGGADASLGTLVRMAEGRK